MTGCSCWCMRSPTGELECPRVVELPRDHYVHLITANSAWGNGLVLCGINMISGRTDAGRTIRIARLHQVRSKRKPTSDEELCPTCTDLRPKVKGAMW